MVDESGWFHEPVLINRLATVWYSDVIPGNVILADIYAAREKDTGLVSSAQLAEKIPGALYMKDFDEIEDYLRKNVSEGDLVVTVGAGNVVQIAEDITK